MLAEVIPFTVFSLMISRSCSYVPKSNAIVLVSMLPLATYFVFSEWCFVHSDHRSVESPQPR